MSWNPITTANIRLQPAEQTVLDNITGSTSVCAEILATVIAEFIEAIQQGGNQFATDGSLPDTVRPQVIARTRWLWLCEFPELKKFQTKERSELNDAAVKFRDLVASGRPKIAPPGKPSPAGVTPIVTMPSLGTPKLLGFKWGNEDGI